MCTRTSAIVSLHCDLECYTCIFLINYTFYNKITSTATLPQANGAADQLQITSMPSGEHSLNGITSHRYYVIITFNSEQEAYTSP